MKKTVAIAATVLTSALSLTSSGQVTISDFSSLNTQSPIFNDTWSFSGTNQFTQNSGFISIGPVNGGNPTENGNFNANPVASNLSAQPNIALTARFDLDNADPNITIGFMDDSFVNASAPFSGFNTSGFSTVAVPRSQFVTEGSFNWANVTQFTISGGNPSGSSAVRWSVDNLQAVPEPSTYALMALGGLVLFYIARRRKAQQV